MPLVKGQLVRHPSRPDWGIGEIVDVQVEGKVRVDFSNAGFKTIRTDLISLLQVGEADREKSIRKVDIERVRLLCDRFYAEMTSNRRSTDDGQLAKNVMRDLERYGDLGRATRTQLLRWCHTEGNPYQNGVPIAREICIAIYGCIPPKDW